MGTNNMFSIPKLTGRDNYTSWKFAMEAYLQHDDLWECVIGESKDVKKDVKAKSKIILLIDPQLYVHVQNAKTSMEVWDNLKTAFEDSGLLRKVGLLRDLINTNLESSASVEEYISKIMTSAHKLRDIGFKVDDEWLGTLMLAGLPDLYRPMIMGIESSGIIISADLIKTKLLQEVKSTDTTNTAFYTNSNRSTPNKNSKPNKDSNANKSGPRCYNCNKYGHLSKQCWFKNKNKKDDKNNGFVAAFSATTLNDATSWYVDSGASAHMTMHRDWLENESAPPVQSIRIADNKMLQVQSCGNVTIKVLNENTGAIDCIQIFNIRGQLAPVFTPFDDDGNIKAHIIPEYLKYLNAHGVDGILVGGTTGEAMSLSVNERKVLLETWVEAAKPVDVKIIAQVGGAPMPDVLELAKHAELTKVDAIMTLPELYYKPKTVDQLVCYLEAVSNEAPSLPLIYYHFPIMTEVDVNMSELFDQASSLLPNFKGTKADLTVAVQVADQLDEDSRVFIANHHFAPAVLMGHDCSIATVTNMFPDLVHSIIDSVKSGDVMMARTGQEMLNRLVDIITAQGDFIPSMKAAMEMVTGIQVGHPRPPQCRLDENGRSYLRESLRRLGVQIAS